MNKFNIGDIVTADGYECRIVDLGEYEGVWYYSCVLNSPDAIYFPREFEESKLKKA